MSAVRGGVPRPRRPFPFPSLGGFAPEPPVYGGGFARRVRVRGGLIAQFPAPLAGHGVRR
jgi:hypothetical protein